MFPNSRNRPVTVARGPVPRDRPVGETSRSRCNRAARLPGPRRQKAPLPRRAWALGCTRASERVSLAMQRSRGTGPRATKKITPSFPRRAVGKPVPRHRSRIPALAGACPPRYGEKTACVTVGRGPVPRHARSNETRGTGPRATGKNGISP